MGTFGWGLAVIMVIVISWVFYRYFAPKGWREWAGAGLVQAFIIALYAEMYGFPLTVYLAIRFFGLDREYVSNSLWSTLLDRQENMLVTTGLYRFARHPQYTGLFIALFGEGIIHWPTIFSISLLPLIVIAYYFLARKEEREMLRKFGDDYRVYQNQVPMFIPQWGRWKAMRKSSQES